MNLQLAGHLQDWKPALSGHGATGEASSLLRFLARGHRLLLSAGLGGLLVLAMPVRAAAQETPTAAAVRQHKAVPARVTEAIRDGVTVTLAGNVHPMARAEFDQGAISDAQPATRMALLLQRSPQQETDLRTLLDQQQDKASPNYHAWLTPSDFGKQYGPADADILAVTGWLQSHGFHDVKVGAGRTIIEFSGNVGQVGQAFHTEIHRYIVRGEEHVANASDPQIPAALAPVIAAVRGLTDFRPKSQLRRLKLPRNAGGATTESKAAEARAGQANPGVTFTSGCGATGLSPCYGVAPADFAKIYNVPNTLDGTGVTIAIVQDSNIYLSDIQQFRSLFGLSQNFTASNVITNGPDPGVLGPDSFTFDEGEAVLDVEWSGAVAQGATIDLVVSEDPVSNVGLAGIDLSAIYIIDNNIAPILSESFGACEAFLGSGGVQFYSLLWEQAAAQGITAILSTGDSGSNSCDDGSGADYSTFGLGVSGLATTPFNVALGGTDFQASGLSAYWSSPGTATESAKSYIPEATWNSGCAATATTGHLATCTAAIVNGNQDPGCDVDGFCPDIEGGSGGQSGQNSTLVNTKPSWQSGIVPATDTGRDIPDISLFAAISTTSNDFYLMCEVDSGEQNNAPCSLNPGQNILNSNISPVGGTSVAAPSFAGIMALVLQQLGPNARVGNANYVLYDLYSQNKSNASKVCLSNTANVSTATCIFYDVIVGNNSVACQGSTTNCSNTSTSANQYGVLVDPSAPTTPAWTAVAGYDKATGLGSVNVANLLTAWSSASLATATAAITASPAGTVVHGSNANFTVTVTSGSGTPTGDVSLIAEPPGFAELGIGTFSSGGSFTLSSGTVSITTNQLPGSPLVAGVPQPYPVVAQYGGDTKFAPAQSAPVNVTVSKENSLTTISMLGLDPGDGLYDTPISSATYGITPYIMRVDVTNLAGTQCSVSFVPCPTGNVTETYDAAMLPLNDFPITQTGKISNTSPLSSAGFLEDQLIGVPGGTHTVVAAYAGDNSYGPSTSSPFSFTVAAAPTTTTVSANPTTTTTITPVQLTAMITATPGSIGNGPTGMVTFSASGIGTLGTATVVPTASSSVSNGPYTTPFGTATLTYPFGTMGSYTVTAAYTSGDLNYMGSSSGLVTVTVTGSAAPTITSLSPSSVLAGAGPQTLTINGTNFIMTPTVTYGGVMHTATFVTTKQVTIPLTMADQATAGQFPVVVTNSGAPPITSNSVNFAVEQAPAITSANSTTFTVGTAGSFTVTATGIPAPTLSETAVLPGGVTFNAATGLLSGTPTGGSGGTYAFTFTAQNGVGTNATQNFTLTVDQSPAITSANARTFNVGTAGSFTVLTSGFPAPALSETGALPAGMGFTDNGNGTATVSGTPGAGTGGTYPLMFTAQNGIGTNATQSFTLTVSQAPVITSANNTTFTVGTAGSFTVTTSGLPTPALSETGALPTGVTFVDNGNGSGKLSGTPAAGTGGAYAITIKATNTMGTASQAFTLTVDQTATISSANKTTFTVGTAGTFNVTTTGGIPTPSLSETGALPAGVTLVDNGNGTATLAGTPGAGTGGTYAITIKATNTAGTASQAFTLTVDQAPAITSAASTTFTVGTAGTFTVTATGFPAPTFSETGALPTGVTLSSGGVLSGTPAAGTGGTYSITITAQNGVAPNATQSFTLTVDQTATISSANKTTFTVGTAGTFNVTTTGGIPTPALSETGALPAGVTLTDNGNGTATLAGTPGAGTGGTYAITIKATNTAGTGTQAFTLTVDQAPAITSANNATFVVGMAGTFTVTASGFPAPTFSETGALPTGVTLSAAGVLSGTPAAGTGGTYSITITAQNGVAPNATQSFTLTVDQGVAFTSANSTTFTVGTMGSFTVTASGFPAPTFSETGALPSGVTLSAAGALSGTPAAGTGGTYPITITAQNGVTMATQSFTLTVDQTATINSANNTTFTVGTAGTFNVTTTGGVPNPALSETGALPTGVTFTDNGNGSGKLSGTPAAGTGGTYAITIKATNAAGTASQAFTLTVDQTAAISSANKTTFTVGTAGTFNVTTTGGVPTPALTETGALPAGVTLTDNGNGTATLAGTAGAGTGGTYAITIKATNTAGTGTQAFTLTVDQAPAITSVNNTIFNVGMAGTFTVTATGFPAPTFSETGALPTGVTLSAAGVLSGTPAAGSGGTYSITITAQNGIGANATQSFTLTVDQAPAITSANNTTFTVGSAGTFTVTATGQPTPSLTETGALPAGVTFVDNGNGTATLAGTPGAGTGGTYPITIKATNAGATATQAFTLTVDQAPAITSAASTTFTVGTAGTFTVTATGFPAPTFSETGALPTGVTLSAAGVLSGTPAAGTGGAYPITIKAMNTTASTTQSFTLTVDQTATISSANKTTFTVGTAGTFNVTTTGGIPTPSLSETGALPAGVTLVDNGNGTATLAGTPGAGTGGTYAITIKATNTAGTGTQAFTLTVDQAPAITSANNATFVVGMAGTFTVTASGFPAPTFSETGALPTGVTLSAAGVLSGTPAAGSGGTYSITITAQNGIGANATQSFTLTVDQAPAITSANATTFTVGSAGTFTVTATGQPTPSLTETGALPTGVTFTDNGNGTATLAGTPGAGTGGTYPITIKATNAGAMATQAFTLTVDQTATITSANNTTFTVGTAGTFNVTTTGGVPNPALSETGALPTGVTFTDNGNGSGKLSGTPAAGTGGTYAITIKATNAAGTASQAFTLTVDQTASITSANNTTFMVGTAGTFNVTTMGGMPTPTLTEMGALPVGVTFVDNGNGTATLAGTPGVGTGGTYPITIKATNGGGTASQAFTLTVDQAPAITSANNATFVVGMAGTFTVTASGFPAPTFSETGALPTGVTLSAAGVLSGTPAAGTGGTYSITITAQNGIGANATQSFTLTVDQAPAITSANNTTFTVGTAGTFTVTATGQPTPSLTETGALPAGVTFTDNGNGTATLAGTPGAGTGGTYAITLKATNAGATASQAFTLTVDFAPTITSAASTTFTVGTAGTFTVTATGLPAPTLSETGALPTGVTFNASTGVLSGTPGAGTGGTYTITFKATNTVGTVSQTFTLTVDQTATITSANNTTFTVGSAGTFTVITSGGMPTPTLTEMGALPAGVTFTDNANGTATLAGTPGAGTGGTYAITIKATNAGGTGTQAFTLTVNQPPAITSGNSTTFTAGTAGSFTVAATGFPAPTFTETGALPAGVTLSSAGVLSGTATASGVFAITITAQNAAGSVMQGFTLTVNNPVPTLTSISPTNGVLGTSPMVTLTGTGFYASAANTKINFSGTGITANITAVTSTTITATLTIATPAAMAGAQNVTVTTMVPNTATSTTSVTFTAGSNFMLAESSMATGVAPGGSFTATLTVTPTTAGATSFPAAVTFSFSGLPALTTCSAAMIAATATTAPGNMSMMMCQTTAPSLLLPRAPDSTPGISPRGMLVLAWGGLLLTMAGAFASRRNPRMQRLAMGCVLVLAVAGLAVACGPSHGMPGTPPGTYPIMVTANAGSATPQSVTFTLTVIPSMPK